MVAFLLELVEFVRVLQMQVFYLLDQLMLPL